MALELLHVVADGEVVLELGAALVDFAVEGVLVALDEVEEVAG